MLRDGETVQPVGLDPGYGLIKVATHSGQLVFPSYVAAIRRVGLAASGLRLARATIVRYRDVEYAVGEGAPLRGAIYESVDDARFVQAPSLALFLAALAKSLPSTEEPIALAVGLPVALLQREPGQEIARNLRRLLLGTHALEVDGAQLTLRIENVWIRAQPLGIWADWAVQQTGVLHAGARRALVGIVDIGFNTIDLIGIQGGQVNADMVAGRDLGVRVLLEDASEDSDMPLHELARRFADGVLRVNETQVNRWASEIAAFVRRRWRRARPQLVILAGGGAALLERYGATRVIKGALSSEVFVPGDPVISGAQGLRKLAVGLLARGETRTGPAQHVEREGEAADGETTAVVEGATTAAPDARP
jgi:hypothetical protein